MAKVIRTIKKFSSRKLEQNTATERETVRALPKIEEGEKEVTKKTLRTSSRIGKEKDGKGKEREKEKKERRSTKTKTAKHKSKGPVTEKQDASSGDKEKRRRRLRKRTDGMQEGENVVARENDDTDSQGLMEQAEYVIEVIYDDGDNYVGYYDFDKFCEVDEPPSVSFSCLTPEEIIQTQKGKYKKLRIYSLFRPRTHPICYVIINGKRKSFTNGIGIRQKRF